MQTRIGQAAPHKNKLAPREYQNPLAGAHEAEQDPALRLLAEWTDNTPKYHQQGLDDTEKLLRLFDNKLEYGPAGGLSRLERFNRAERLGLHPPATIKTLLDQHPEYLRSAYN